MSDLKNLAMADDIQEEKDSLGGFAAQDTDLYDCELESVFTSKSQGGALALNVHAKTNTGAIIRDQFWMTSGDAKGNKNYYVNKKDEKHYLPGFNMANGLCLLTLGKAINELDTEEKVINLYDFDAGGEVATKVDMIEGICGKKITLGVIKQIVDKKKKNDQTGDYEPTGETRTVNVIDRIFRAKDGMTVTEIRAQAEEATFKNKWADKWRGQTQDLSVGKSASGGAAATSQASGDKAEKTNLFS